MRDPDSGPVLDTLSALDRALADALEAPERVEQLRTLLERGRSR